MTLSGLISSHTLWIIVITCGVSVWAWQNTILINRLIMWPPLVQQRGQYDRFVTHGFVHADGMHLLFNMFTLFFFGRAIEVFYRQYLGGMGFALFYLTALVAAMLPSYLQHRNDPQYRSLGASGAVSAVLFAFVLFAPWSTLYVLVIPIPAIVFATLYTAYSLFAQQRGNDNINHSAHLWGAAYGVLVTIALEPRLLASFIQKLLNPPFL
ncbi:MAG: rhomboid family intramembrane serine protease [Pseudomonadota bacterium]|nr:rhomboid family intramembrane serine protease [Pseudomonadota bacterium]